MAGVNKAIIVGRIGKAPDIRNLSGGSTVANFSVATSEQWKDKQTGEKKEKTEWHNIVAFGKLAEICGEYLKKGQQIYLEGRIQTESYEKDGIMRYSTKIIASQMLMLGGRNSSSTSDSYQRRPSAIDSTNIVQVPQSDAEDEEVPF